MHTGHTLRNLVLAAVPAALLACGGSKGHPGPVSPVIPSLAAPEPSPLPDGRSHAYFEMLRARPDVIGAFSLREQSMIDEYSHGPPTDARYVTYDFSNDTDPRRQDAAKITIPPDRVSLPTQVRIPLYRTEPTLVTWDAWFGREFQFANHGIAGYKNFQFSSPNAVIWFEVRSRFIEALPPDIATVDTRGYFRNGMGPNVTKDVPILPQAGTFTIRPETWTRYWALIDIRQTDPSSAAWSTVSLWVADEKQGPVQIIDRRQIKVDQSVGMFWLEYNSSSNVVRTRGPLVGYVRNIVVLSDVTNPASLLERPLP